MGISNSTYAIYYVLSDYIKPTFLLCCIPQKKDESLKLCFSSKSRSRRYISGISLARYHCQSYFSSPLQQISIPRVYTLSSLNLIFKEQRRTIFTSQDTLSLLLQVQERPSTPTLVPVFAHVTPPLPVAYLRTHSSPTPHPLLPHSSPTPPPILPLPSPLIGGQCLHI